ncbi:MAG: glycosyltransferase, partial [Caulobacteraceae bacterium]|nr:glycosyltransferase [Caulobacteraceae bacterium]
AVAIVEAVRAAGHDLRLHIVGSAAPGQTSWLQGLVAGRDWISWRPGLDREALESLVARQRWGLHCYRFEHYGFAPAELQALGCITLVHDSGGQREIVRSPDQRYRDVDDAVRKFLAILRTPERHPRLVEEGLGAAAEHTTAKFEREFRSVVEAMLAEPRRGRAAPSAALHPGSV